MKKLLTNLKPKTNSSNENTSNPETRSGKHDKRRVELPSISSDRKTENPKEVVTIAESPIIQRDVVSEIHTSKGVTYIEKTPRTPYANEPEMPSQGKEELSEKDTEGLAVDHDNAPSPAYDNQFERLPETEDLAADRGNTVFKSFIGVNRLPKGKILIGDRLGSGAFGDVYRGEWGEKKVALKKIDFKHARERLGLSKDDALEALSWEMSRLSTVNHPNLVQFYGIYQHENEGSTYLVTEFCEGGDLRKELDKNKNIAWEKWWQLALQITQALAYLHRKGVLHRDLKAENILLDDNTNAKLADLGVAQVDALLQESEAKVVADGLQDLRFIAPENVDEPTLSTQATDIYALGLVLWEIASGEEPDWTGGDPLEEHRIPRSCPQSFKELILACCDIDPRKRPNAQELLVKLEALGAEFAPDRHLLIKACERLEKFIHHKRQEGLAYVAPFVTASEVKESIESYWSRIEASEKKREKAWNPPLELKETFENFIKSKGSSTLLLLGEAGLGKTLTTYLWGDQLLSQWWAHINKGEKAPEYFPLFIRPSLSAWSHDSIEGAFLKVVKEYNLPSNVVPLVFIDGYDELSPSARGAEIENLVKHLGLQAYPQAKLIVTCRPNAVEASELKSRFSFKSQLETRYFLPFSIDQLLTYLKTQLSWNDTLYEEYKNKLQNTGNVRTVLRNPFVLHLIKESWETVSKKAFHQLSRYQIYEGFIEHTLKTQQSLISPNLQKLLQESFPDLLTSYQAFASAIAWSAFQKNSITLDWKEVKGLSKWVSLKEYAEVEAKKEFSERQEKLKAELEKASAEEKTKITRRNLLKEGDYVRMTSERVQQFEAKLPLKLRGGEGVARYEYSHKSLFEYFMAKRVILLKNNQSSESIIEEGIRLLAGRPIQEEKEMLIFFEEGWGREEVNHLKEPLFEIIQASRKDSSKTQSSANAATLLAAAHVPFSGRDLSDVRIKGADLSNAVLDHTCFYKADLQDAILHRVWLQKTDLREANLAGVDFGEFPSLKFESEVHCVSYSKDGMQMAVGIENGDIELYKKEEKVYKHVKTLKGHSGSIKSVAYSPDGKQLASGSEDQTVWIWDIETLQAITQLKGHSRSVRSVTYSPNGKQLASGSEDQTVWIWDTKTLQAIAELKGHSSWVWSGEQLVSDGSDNNEAVRIFGTDDPWVITQFIGRFMGVWSVAYSPDGKQLASANDDSTVWIWDTETLQAITQLKGHSNRVDSVAYSPDGKQLASACDDGTVWIWDIETLQAITQLKGHSKSIRSVTYSPDGKQLALGSEDKTVSIWDTETLQAIAELKGHSWHVSSVTYSPNGKQLVSGSWDKTVRIWDTETLQPVTRLKGHSGYVHSVTYSPDGKQLASGSLDETVWIWDTETLQPVTQLKGPSESVNSVTYSPDGKQLASASIYKTVWIWDTETLQPVTRLKGHSSSRATCVTYSPDGKQLTLGGGDLHEGVLWVWDTNTFQTITQLKVKGVSGYVDSVTYSPDGKQFATASTTVWIWDTQTLQPITELKGHSRPLKSVAYSPDGKQLASAGGGRGKGELWIWDTETLQPVTRLEGRSSYVNSVMYSPDGKQLVSGSGDTVEIWDTKTLQPVTQFKGHLGIHTSVTYSPDGKQLVSWSDDKSIFLWTKQASPCLPGAQENWQLIRRFEMSSCLFAEGVFLKGANISESNRELLKQKGANDEQDLPEHSHFSS